MYSIDYSVPTMPRIYPNEHGALTYAQAVHVVVTALTAEVETMLKMAHSLLTSLESEIAA